MYRKEVRAHSPLRVLEKSIHGGLGPGNLGVVLARAGVGKTAFLAQLGLDDLLGERRVLHVSTSSSVADVRRWYDVLFDDLLSTTPLDDPAQARLLIERNRMIQTYPGHSLSSQRLRGVMNMLAEHADFVPSTILIDGVDWTLLDPTELEEIKDIALVGGAELWITAVTTRHARSGDGLDLPPPCDRFDRLIDVAIHLSPVGSRVALRLLRDHDTHELASTTLELEPVTMRLSDGLGIGASPEEPRRSSEVTLISGGAPGTESAFGELAERYGLREVNFSFAGREMERARGLTELSESELRQGDVSLAYVSHRMGREYSSAPDFRRVLQTIWHQIRSAQQVLVVGALQEDGTVRGGTGWGAELARLWNKPLWVFDQGAELWFSWSVMGQEWERCEPPTIQASSFCGTGSRSLSAVGREAIELVFERSFGQH